MRPVLVLFLLLTLDLCTGDAAVKEQVQEGKTLPQINLQLPSVDQNWIPKDLSLDVEASYTEILIAS